MQWEDIFASGVSQICKLFVIFPGKRWKAGPGEYMIQAYKKGVKRK